MIEEYLYMNDRSLESVKELLNQEFPYLLRHVDNQEIYCVAEEHKGHARAKPQSVGQGTFPLAEGCWEVFQVLEAHKPEKCDWSKAPEWATQLRVGKTTGQHFWANPEKLKIMLVGGSIPRDWDTDHMDNYKLVQRRPKTMKDKQINAVDILKEAAGHIDNRAAERDRESERSMKNTVDAFNAMFNKDITEEQGWQFMVLLKMSRAAGGSFKLDDFEDMAAYAALSAEAAS